ncbi:MAG: FKBP-type peptidyl-prolyl cis-trans isomerase [Cyclobacteriaceae bacterium]|uniref:FKBP-type peptidyl-prolyl cis-trans isomerase n=1 Tax=Nonlabens ulvanivorans TaxID=906888 RepID=UPI003282C15D
MKFINKTILFSFLLGSAMLTSCLDNDLVTNTERFTKETKLIDNYLADNGLEDQAIVDTQSGLRYIINDEGDSLTIEDYDSMRVDYSIRLLKTGEEVFFGEDEMLKLDDQIVGWRILMPNVMQGGDITMFIPSYYGFGGLPRGEAPAYSTLIVDVALHEIKHLTEEEQFAYDQSRIDAYLEGSEVNVRLDTLSGMRYSITTEGTGASPGVSSTINVSYTGYLLDDRNLTTSSFDSQQSLELKLSELIEGWQILMPYVKAGDAGKAGGEIRMYIPSKYGYGRSRVSTLPSNAVLIFDVRLNSVL